MDGGSPIHFVGLFQSPNVCLGIVKCINYRNKPAMTHEFAQDGRLGLNDILGATEKYVPSGYD